MALDFKVALANLEGDEALLIELAGLFCDESAKYLLALKEAVAREDGKAIRAAAHSLKGAVSAFTAQGAFDAAAKLEKLAENGELAKVPEASAALEAEVEELRAALQGLSSSQRISDSTTVPPKRNRREP